MLTPRYALVAYVRNQVGNLSNACAASYTPNSPIWQPI